MVGLIKTAWIRIFIRRSTISILIFDSHVNRLIAVFDFDIADIVLVKFVGDFDFLIFVINPYTAFIEIFYVRCVQFLYNFVFGQRTLSSENSTEGGMGK